MLEVLSELAGRTPDSRLTYDGKEGSARRHVECLWHEALDNPGLYYRQPEPDPWAADGPGGYSEEPPF